MGIPTSIKTLLSGRVVEWARIEFKETWDPEASLKTICAFANDIDNWGGGYLVIGVRDKQGQPDSLPGVPAEKIDGYLKDLLNKCKRIQPEYMPITEVAEYQGKHLMVSNDTVNADLTETEKRVLDAIKVDAHVTILKMAEKLGVSKITINRAVKGLKEKNLIQREGSAKTGKWSIIN